MCKIFRCPVCDTPFILSDGCPKCGFVAENVNRVWQLSDMPDIVTDGEGDKYIGYEHIGEHYSGNRRYTIEERDRLSAAEIAQLTGSGIFLDIACGDGCLTVPAAEYGVQIIAGDISNAMLGILQGKAAHNGISLENVTLCRMNALDLPLGNETVDVAVANSVLHLISNPQKVISEIYRVLKKGGVFVCFQDAPGKDSENCFDNTKYNEIVNALYRKYWEALNKYGIFAKKYSWHFDREAYCREVFGSAVVKTIKRGALYRTPLKDGFLPRFIGRGFSDQMEVPPALHREVIVDLQREFEELYGSDFVDCEFQGVEDDLLITIYKK